MHTTITQTATDSFLAMTAVQSQNKSSQYTTPDPFLIPNLSKVSRIVRQFATHANKDIVQKIHITNADRRELTLETVVSTLTLT